MKKIYLTIVAIVLSTCVWAQTLRGTVVDKTTNSPLAGANILVNGKGGTVADATGTFSIECSGSTEIVVSFIGYETTRKIISDCSQALTVSLTSTSQLLNEVEITATSELNHSLLSQPVSITKLGLTEIKRSTGLFMDDVINTNIPGVTMQRRTVGAGQQFNIRGYGGGGPGVRGINSNFDQQGIKAYLNGIPITDAEGITLMDDIDFGSVGNVEITKGPSGTLYGLAIAGVINMQTMRPEKEKTSIGQDVLLGSYGLQRFTSHLQTSTKNMSLLINYGHQSFDGFMDHTASTKKFVNVMGDFRVNEKQSLSTYLGWSDSYDERNGELTEDQYRNFDYSGNPAYIKNNAHSNVISFRVGIGHTYQFAKNMSNTTSLFGTGLNSNVSSAGGWTDKAPINFGLRSVFDMKFKLNETMQLSGVTGVETQKQYAQILAYPMVPNNADPNGYNIIGALRSNQSTLSGTYSLFTQWTLSLPKDFSLTAGIGTSTMNITLKDKFYVAANNTATNTVPMEYKTHYNNLTSPRVALNKVINNHMSAYVSYSQGYRAPVASNIYTPLANKANTDLKPENGKQFEVGTKGSLLSDRLSYELAYFSATFSNKMTLVGVPNAAGTATLYSYVINSGTLNNKGVEAQVKYAAYSSTDGFIKLVRPFANVTYSDFTYGHFTFQNNVTVAPADYNGNKVAGVPKMVYNAGVDFVSNVGLYVNATYMHRDKMAFTPDGVAVADAYSLLNAKMGFRKTIGAHFDVDAYFGANNIMSTQYYQMVFVNQLPDAYLPGPKDINYFGGLNLKYIF